MEKAVSSYKADQLIASLLSSCSVQSSLTVCKFRAAVFRVLRVTAHHAIFSHSESEGRSTELMHIAAIVLMHFGRHNIRHQRFAVCTHPSMASFAVFFPHKTVKSGVGTCPGMGACPVQYGTGKSCQHHKMVLVCTHL